MLTEHGVYSDVIHNFYSSEIGSKNKRKNDSTHNAFRGIHRLFIRAALLTVA